MIDTAKKGISPWPVIIAGTAIIGGIFVAIIWAVFNPSPVTLVEKYMIKSALTDKCVANYGFGAGISLVDCNVLSHPYYYSYNQTGWLFKAVGNSTDFSIVSLLDGACLQADSSSGVGMARCTGGVNQTWTRTSPSAEGKRQLKSGLSNKCLSADARNLNHLIQENCSDFASRLWTLIDSDGPNPPHDSGKGEQCDACNPANPECAGGLVCLDWQPLSHQWICSAQCSSAMPCSAGYQCVNFHCVPSGQGCPLL